MRVRAFAVLVMLAGLTAGWGASGAAIAAASGTLDEDSAAAAAGGVKRD